MAQRAAKHTALSLTSPTAANHTARHRASTTAHLATSRGNLSYCIHSYAHRARGGDVDHCCGLVLLWHQATTRRAMLVPLLHLEALSLVLPRHRALRCPLQAMLHAPEAAA